MLGGRPLPLLALCAATAAPALAMDRDQGLERIREQLAQSCAEGSQSACLGIEASQCTRLAREVVAACADHFAPGEAQREAFGECIGAQSRQRLGVTRAEMRECRAHAGDAAPSPAVPEAARDELAAIKQRVAQAAEGSESAVTLPLYPNHALTAHYPDMAAFTMSDEPLGEDAVSVAMMTTPDPVAEVVDFYADRLEGFTRYREAADNVTFAKGMPADIETPASRRWMEALARHEHVAIYRLSGTTHIQVGYRPE